MSALEWVKQPLTRELARSLRAATRKSKPSIDDHTFKFTDLKEMWAADNVHVALTHDEDRKWQYWYQDPKKGWTIVSIHTSRKKAFEAALESLPDEPEVATDEGVYVLARFNEKSRWMRTRIQSSDGLEKIKTMYSRLGCEDIKVEKVGKAS